MGVLGFMCEDECPLHQGLDCRLERGHPPPHRAKLGNSKGDLTIEWRVKEMQFLVYSRQLIEAISPLDKPHLIISIRTPGDPKEVKLPTNAQTRGVLRMEFFDLDRMPTQPIPYLLLGVPDDVAQRMDIGANPEYLFNAKHAKAILDFVRPWLDQVEQIAVHCDAGWSRSPAVAAALGKGLFDQDDAGWFKVKTPNMLVYRKLLEAIHEEDGGSSSGLESPA